MHHFCNLQTRERTHAVLVIGLYELLGNPTTELTRALLRLCTYIDHIIVPDVMGVMIDKVVVLYRTVLMTYFFLFFAPKTYNYLAFHSFDYERTG